MCFNTIVKDTFISLRFMGAITDLAIPAFRIFLNMFQHGFNMHKRPLSVFNWSRPQDWFILI